LLVEYGLAIIVSIPQGIIIMDFSFGNKILSDLNSEAVMEIELTGRLVRNGGCLTTGTQGITTGLPIISPFY